MAFVRWRLLCTRPYTYGSLSHSLSRSIWLILFSSVFFSFFVVALHIYVRAVISLLSNENLPLLLFVYSHFLFIPSHSIHNFVLFRVCVCVCLCAPWWWWCSLSIRRNEFSFRHRLKCIGFQCPYILFIKDHPEMKAKNLLATWTKLIIRLFYMVFSLSLSLVSFGFVTCLCALSIAHSWIEREREIEPKKIRCA